MRFLRREPILSGHGEQLRDALFLDSIETLLQLAPPRMFGGSGYRARIAFRGCKRRSKNRPRHAVRAGDAAEEK
jgi:hypothetical protein